MTEEPRPPESTPSEPPADAAWATSPPVESAPRPAPPPIAQSSWDATAHPPPRSGPVSGLVYAGLGRRTVAFVIDVFLAFLAIAGFGLLVGIALAVGGQSDPNVTAIIFQVVAFVVFGLYFILAWRQRRATLGQRLLGLTVGNLEDGATLSWTAAFIRWLALTLGPIPAIVSLILPSATGLVGVLQIAWVIVLLVTTATSPTKQGIHDRWAHSLVVQRA